MAIKIIKEGKVPEKRFRVTCKKCGTIYEFLDTDAYAEYDVRDHETRYGINCPLCKEFVYVSEKDVLKQQRV